MNRMLQEIVIYQKHDSDVLQIYILKDLDNEQYAVAKINYLYSDSKPLDFMQDDYYFGVLIEELNHSFLEWFSSIESAVSASL